MPAQDASLMANCFTPIDLAQEIGSAAVMARSSSLPLKTHFMEEAPRVPSVRCLHQSVEPVTGATLCADILSLFLQNADLYAIPVVDLARVPRALIERYSYIEYFSRPYSIELFGGKPVSQIGEVATVLNKKPVIVDAETSIDDAFVCRAIFYDGCFEVRESKAKNRVV